MLSSIHFHLVQGPLGQGGRGCLKGTDLFLPVRQWPPVEWGALNQLHFWRFPCCTASVPQYWAFSVVRGKVGLAKFLLKKNHLVEFICDTSDMQVQEHNSLFQLAVMAEHL